MIPPFSRTFAATALGACALLVGCGGSPIPPASGTLASLTGNWQIQTGPPASNSLPTSAGMVFLGDLQQNGSAISGNFQFADVRNLQASCVPIETLVAFTGSVTASGEVSLTSSVGGGVATISFTAPSSTAAFLPATLTITGGSCALPSTSSIAAFIPNASGTYSGPVTITNDVTGTVSTGSAQLLLTQSTSPNSLGEFPLTGTLTLTSPSCSTTSTLTGTQTGIGYNLTSTNPQDPLLTQLLVLGTNDPAVPEAPVNLLAATSLGRVVRPPRRAPWPFNSKSR